MIAALYDVHGNLPALEAVLDEVAAADCEEIVVGGDVVPGPMPGACLAALKSQPLPVRFLYGNGERNVLAIERGDVLERVPPPVQEILRWTADALSPEELATLRDWPPTVRREAPGLEVLFCHATPRDENEIFTRLTPEDRLRPVFEGVTEPLVVCGHTHMQFDRGIDGTRIVNAGSVGMPFGDPGAYWVVLRPGDVDLRRTEYDLEAAAAAIAGTGYPFGYDVRRPPGEAEKLEQLEAAALS